MDMRDDDGTAAEPVALRRARQMNDLRYRRDEPDAAFDQAMEAAENLRDREAVAEQAAFQQRLRNTGNLAVRTGALAAIEDVDVQRQAMIKVEEFEHRERKQKAEDMKQVAMARLIPSARRCGRERINGVACSNPVYMHQTICTQCRNSQMRRPAGVSQTEWEKEKKRRREKREEDAEERKEKNHRLAMEGKKAKVAEHPFVSQAAPAPNFVAPQASAPPQFDLVQKVCHCGEDLKFGHIYTCNKCGMDTCHVVECIKTHKESCPKQ